MAPLCRFFRHDGAISNSWDTPLPNLSDAKPLLLHPDKPSSASTFSHRIVIEHVAGFGAHPFKGTPPQQIHTG
jgi:hypothetical protein